MKILKNINTDVTRDLFQLLSRDGINVVITGDSLAYNRYDFDAEHRINAYDCYPGMPSWSFMIRDVIHQNDKWYAFGDELGYNDCAWVKGNAHELVYNPDNKSRLSNAVKYSCLNHGKASTLFIENPEQICSFVYKHSNKITNKAVLYMQKRPDRFACNFDIYVDGKLALSEVCTGGKGSRFQGWEPFEIEIPVPGDGKHHEISFQNIRNSLFNIKSIDNNQSNQSCEEQINRNCESKITIAGVGTKRAKINLTGCGSQTTEFFLNNMKERIMQYNPDLFIFIIGANDRAHLTPEKFDFNLRAIINIIKEKKPECEILLISPPRSEAMEGIEKDKTFKASVGNNSDVACIEFKSFMDSMYKVSKEYNCIFLDLIKLFKDIPTKAWRFDNIHFTKWGNTYVARTILDMILPNGGFYSKELVDAELWF
jgi:lysophospholipase L1-like esterase